jgi:hypothetical protein
VGALNKGAQEKRKRDGAARAQRHRDNLALEGLTPLDRLSEEALAWFFPAAAPVLHFVQHTATCL